MRRTLLAVLGVLALASVAGCASGAVGRARVAEQQQDYDRAVVEYTQALKERPEDKDATTRSRSRQDSARRKTTFNAAAGSRPSASTRRPFSSCSWPRN